MRLMDYLRAAPSLVSLKKWNVWLAGLCAVQAVAILLLSTHRTFGVTLPLLQLDSLQSTASGTPVLAPATHHFFDVDITYVIVAFLLAAGLMHALFATIGREQYEAELGQKQNRLRWIGSAIISSLMLVAVALIVGMYDVVSLLLLAGLNAAAYVLLMIVESVRAGRGRNAATSRLLFGLATSGGVLTSIAILLYVVATNVDGTGHLPGFIYGVLASMALMILAGMANVVLILKRVGPWRVYAYGERLAMVVCLLATSLLAWQIFLGMLNP